MKGWLAATLAVALGVASTGQVVAQSVDKQTVVAGVQRQISILDPQVGSSGDTQYYAWHMFDTLYGFDSKGNLIPRSATGFEMSPDGLTYTFKLRSDVTFHNGDKFTSEDVKFSMERILDPATKSVKRPFFEPVIKSVETPDATTVVFHLKKPYGAFINELAGSLPLLPKAYTAALPSVEAFSQKPVGSGPYKFKEFRVGQNLTLERFDGFYGEKPTIGTVVLKIITDPFTRLNALKAGEVDVITDVPLNEVANLKSDAKFEVVTVPVNSPMYVRLYTRDENSPLAKRDVRLALNYALDREAIIKGVYHGVGKPMSSFISQFFPYGSDPNLPKYPYDPKKAKELLKQAGYPNGFSTSIYSANSYPSELAVTLAAFWSQIGVQVKINQIDFAAWMRLNNTQQSGPMSVSAFGNAIYDPMNAVVGAFSASGTWSSYTNPEVEKIIGPLFEATGADNRGKLFRQVERILHEDAAGVFILDQFVAYGSRQGLSWTATTGSGFLNFADASWK